jgi:5-methylcytosine-specific restriction endonuclease McrA
VEVRPDWKPRARLRLSPGKYRALVRDRLEAEPLCRVCGVRRADGCHHLVPKDYGGDDVAANLVPLCGSGTTGCHGRVEARHRRTRSELRAALRLEELTYVVARAGGGDDDRGVAWLDRHYPAA